MFFISSAIRLVLPSIAAAPIEFLEVELLILEIGAEIQIIRIKIV